jgi:hypothetical protein
LPTYAYSEIRYDAEVDELQNQAAGQVGTITEVISVKPGEKVTQDQIGVDDETWEGYYRDLVIGDEPLPDDLGADESLNAYRLRKANEEAALVAAGAPIRATTSSKKAAAKEE